MLILLFLFFGYLALANAFDDPARGDKPAAILAVVGVVNIPVIKFSVYFFNTLHQQSTLFDDLFGSDESQSTVSESAAGSEIGGAALAQGSALPPEMMLPLMLMLAGFTLLFLVLLVIRMRGELTAVRIRALRAGLAISDR